MIVLRVKNECVHSVALQAITIIFIACIDFFLLILLVGNFNKLVEKLLSDHTNEIIANEKNAGKLMRSVISFIYKITRNANIGSQKTSNELVELVIGA